MINIVPSVSFVPVAFREVDGTHQCVAVLEGGALLHGRADGSVEQTVCDMHRHVLEDIIGRSGVDVSALPLAQRTPALAGYDLDTDGLVFTLPLPHPFADPDFDVLDDTNLSWGVLSDSSGRRADAAEDFSLRRGPDAIVLDYWRQALEETDAALGFLARRFSLWSLRRIYDAVWGYNQDPSGFKRWALDDDMAEPQRRGRHRSGSIGAFHGRLTSTIDPEDNGPFFESLSDLLTQPADLGKAGAAAAGTASLVALGPGLLLPAAIAAATVGVIRAKRRPGPPPVWLEQTEVARDEPTCLSVAYSPRPNWTRWAVPV